jgi:retron-type reverse transcriptase
MSGTNQLWSNAELVPSSEQLLEQMLEWANIKKAARQVIRNKGIAGIDGMEVSELPQWLESNFASLKMSIETDTYRPKPVLVCEIEKAGGGIRQLGIPTVIDRMHSFCC